MAEVAFIDSAGLAMLLGALKHARLRAGDLSITNVSARLMRIFTITGLDKVFTLPAWDEVSTHHPPAGPPSMARRPVESNPL